jgi:hypothetical protein
MPAVAERAAADQVVAGGLRYLTHYNQDWKLVPALATRIPTVEIGGVLLADGGMRVSWTIRPDAR